MGTDPAYNPLMWVGLCAAIGFMIAGIIYSHRVKKAKMDRMEKKLDELDKKKEDKHGEIKP